MISNSGKPGDPDADAFNDKAMVDANAVQRVLSAGPSAMRPALMKYGDILDPRR